MLSTNIKAGDVIVHHRHSAKNSLLVLHVNYSLKHILTVHETERRSVTIPFSVLNSSYTIVNTKTSNKKQLQTEIAKAEARAEERLTKLIDKMVDAEFDERADALEKLIAKREPKVPKKLFTDHITINNRLSVHSDVHRPFTWTGFRIFEIENIDRITKKIEISSKRYGSYIFALSVLNDNEKSFMLLPPKELKITDKKHICMVEKKSVKEVHVNYYNETWRDKRYNKYCKSLGRYIEEDKTYEFKTNPEITEGTVEKISEWLKENFNKSELEELQALLK